MGLSEALSARESKIDVIELRKALGTAPTEFHGYCSESSENVLILSGLMMPYSRIDAMMESVQKEADNVQNSMKALTQVRQSKSIDIFGKKNIPVTVQPTKKGISALDVLKAKRISK